MIRPRPVGGSRRSVHRPLEDVARSLVSEVLSQRPCLADRRTGHGGLPGQPGPERRPAHRQRRSPAAGHGGRPRRRRWPPAAQVIAPPPRRRSMRHRSARRPRRRLKVHNRPAAAHSARRRHPPAPAPRRPRETAGAAAAGGRAAGRSGRAARPKLALLISSAATSRSSNRPDEKMADILTALGFVIVVGDENDEIEDAPNAGLVVISQSADAAADRRRVPELRLAGAGDELRPVR